MQKVANAASSSAARPVAVEVFGLDIGDHGHRGVEFEEGPVVLVGLADHEFAAADAGVGVGEPRATTD